MALAVHNGSEIGRILLWIAAFAVFVVVALTWVPDWIAPQGEQGAPEVGRTTRMIQ
jgi:lipopolysaccharide export LptBFGC system permease protein LptF